MHVCLIFWRPDSLDVTASSPLDRPDISNTSAVPTTAPLRAALMQLYAATVLASLPFQLHCAATVGDHEPGTCRSTLLLSVKWAAIAICAAVDVCRPPAKLTCLAYVAAQLPPDAHPTLI